MCGSSSLTEDNSFRVKLDDGREFLVFRFRFVSCSFYIMLSSLSVSTPNRLSAMVQFSLVMFTDLDQSAKVVDWSLVVLDSLNWLLTCFLENRFSGCTVRLKCFPRMERMMDSSSGFLTRPASSMYPGEEGEEGDKDSFSQKFNETQEESSGGLNIWEVSPSSAKCCSQSWVSSDCCSRRYLSAQRNRSLRVMKPCFPANTDEPLRRDWRRDTFTQEVRISLTCRCFIH